MVLTLIGINHIDYKGYERLTKFLNYFKPELIGVEETKEDFEKHIAYTKLLSKHENLETAIKNFSKIYPEIKTEDIKEYFEIQGYELKAVVDYQEKTGTKIIYCFDPKIRKEIDLRDGELDDSNSKIREEFKSMFTQENTSIPKESLEEEISTYKKMDEFAEKKIRENYDKDTKMVYVGGLNHIFGNYNPDLFDRLQDLKPIGINLIIADKLNA